jgi:hypothetical protein
MNGKEQICIIMVMIKIQLNFKNSAFPSESSWDDTDDSQF